MSRLSEFHSKNSFEYILFLINLLLERIDNNESNTITNESVDEQKSYDV